MSSKTTYLLGILTTLVVGALLQWYFCCNCCKSPHSTTNRVSTATEPQIINNKTPFFFSDNNTSFKSEDNLNFAYSDHNIITPFSEYLTSCLKELSQYFINHPEKKLKVIGLYHMAEKNLSEYETLGLARSWAIKTLLTMFGLPEKQIAVKGESDSTLKADANHVLFGPYRFETITQKTDPLDLKLKNEIINNPILLHFLPGLSYKTITNSEKQHLKIVAKYLMANNTASCTIIGHTDSVKSEESNLVLGQKRAEFTKSQLIKLGVDENKITLLSKGESDPIASNKNAIGKAKNRRTEIQLNTN